jgi:hypothetical protein
MYGQYGEASSSKKKLGKRPAEVIAPSNKKKIKISKSEGY